MVKEFKNEKSKGVLIQVPEESSDYQIEAEFRPYSVWLYMKGRSMPMPIGNMIYPYRHDQLIITGTMVDADGKWLILEEIKDPHEVSKVKCDLCGKEWVAVRPLGLTELECPNCGNMAQFENVA